MAVTIRSASSVLDMGRVTDMVYRFLKETPYGAIVGDVSPGALTKAIGMVLQHGVIFVAESGPPELRQVVGFAALLVASHPLNGHPYGDELAVWVEPEHRTGMVGPRLVQAAEKWARQRNLTSLKMVAPVGSRFNDYLRRRGYHAVETAWVLKL